MRKQFVYINSYFPYVSFPMLPIPSMRKGKNRKGWRDAYQRGKKIFMKGVLGTLIKKSLFFVSLIIVNQYKTRYFEGEGTILKERVLFNDGALEA